MLRRFVWGYRACRVGSFGRQCLMDVVEVAGDNPHQAGDVGKPFVEVVAGAVLQPTGIAMQQLRKLAHPLGLRLGVADFPIVPMLAADTHVPRAVGLTEAESFAALSNTPGEVWFADDLEHHMYISR